MDIDPDTIQTMKLVLMKNIGKSDLTEEMKTKVINLVYTSSNEILCEYLRQKGKI